MTTVAVNRYMIAADKQFTHSGGIIFTGRTKIHEIPSNVANEMFGVKRAFVGFCGNADAFADAIGYLFSPSDNPPKIKGVEMLMLTDKGEIYHATNFRNWLQICDPYFAIGSGMAYAVAAMEAGKTPYEAVKIASKYDSNTGRGFNKLVMKEM